MDSNKGLVQVLVHEVRKLREELQHDSREKDVKIDRIEEVVTGLRINMEALKIKTGLMSILGGATVSGAAALLKQMLGK